MARSDFGTDRLRDTDTDVLQNAEKSDDFSWNLDLKYMIQKDRNENKKIRRI